MIVHLIELLIRSQVTSVLTTPSCVKRELQISSNTLQIPPQRFIKTLCWCMFFFCFFFHFKSLYRELQISNNILQIPTQKNCVDVFFFIPSLYTSKKIIRVISKFLKMTASKLSCIYTS